MENVKRIGGDVGNDAVKIELEDANWEGKKEFEVMNIVAQGYTRRIIGEEKGHLSNLLDVNIEISEIDMGRYFVGGLAFKESRGDALERTKADIKATDINTMIILMTSVAYALFDPNNPVKTENIALGSLLPTEEYFDDNLREKFKEKLQDKYRIKFNSPAFKKADITLNIVDEEITPEGTAGHLACIYNYDGSLKKGIENINDEIHLGIFIGSITTEVSLYANGEWEPRGFFGIPVGTSDPLDKIINDLGIEMSRHQVDYYIRSKKTLKANVNGQAVDLTKKLNKSSELRFAHFAKLVANGIYKKLSLNGINTDLITRVNLGGGGAITLIDSFTKEFAKVGNVKLAENPRFKNAEGALMSIIQKQMNQEAAADEVLS